MQSKMRQRLVFPLTLLVVLTVWAFPARAVEVQRVVSPGGIEAWLVEDHSNPIISLNLAFRGGAALDPAGKEGLAHMASGLIDEGAGELDSQAFQGKLEDLSIRLRFSSGQDTFSGSLMTLTENSVTAFELLRLALTEPRFDDEPVERIRAQILASHAREAEDPDSIVQRSLQALLYPDHPYGRPVNGHSRTIAAITRDDLIAFSRARLARDNLFIGVVGDITAEDLANRLDETFGPLPERAEPWDLPVVIPAAAGDLIVVERNMPQSIAALAQSGIKRDDPDFYVAYVVNYILGGGGFASRLFEEVREKRGLAYSVYSYLAPQDFSASIIGGVATQNPRAGQSLDVIREEWRRMAQEGPTAEELEAAKTYLTGSFPLRFSSSSAISGMLVNMQLDNLGIDYLEKRNSFIEAVTLEDAKRVANRLYDADKLTIAVIGKPEGVTPTRNAPEIEG
jgi:zinc protease